MNSTQIHTVYRKLDGTRVPSVTTYLGILNKSALIQWAWELGVQGLDYRKVRDRYGETGTLVHYLALCKLSNGELDLSEYTQKDIESSIVPMSKFDEWLSGHKVKPILMETPLVSETHSFGGTPDFYGLLDRKKTLIDFKTSSGVYLEHFCQLAAYMKLLEEHGHKIEQVRLLRLGRSETEGFDEKSVGDLSNHWQIFLACQRIYDLQKVIRNTLKEDI